MIKEEGLNSLTLLELKQACADRGMDSMGTRKTLEALMEEWLDLSLNHKVSIAMLILSRAFRLMSSNYQRSAALRKVPITNHPSQGLEKVETVNSTTTQPHFAKERSAESGEVGSVEELSEKSSIMLDKVEQIEDALSQSLSPASFQDKRLEEIKSDLDELINKPADTSSTSGTPTEATAATSLEKRVAKMVKSLEADVGKVKKASSSKQSLDLDNDGLVSCKELSAFLKERVDLTDDEVKEFLERLDADADGYVPVEDLKNLTDKVVTEDHIRNFLFPVSKTDTPFKAKS